MKSCNNCSHSKLVEHGKFYPKIEEYEHTDLVCKISGDLIENENITCEEWEED
ncbi:MAG TPA: hypothetical protein VIK78_14485 [Ruminiclostridium sp.]